MGWMDDIKTFLGDAAADPVNTPGSVIRYGVTPQHRVRMTTSGAIPGQPPAFLPSGEENPEANRYAAQYLAETRGHLPRWLNEAGNSFAYDDRELPPQEAMRIKMAGQRGMGAARQKGGLTEQILRTLTKAPF